MLASFFKVKSPTQKTDDNNIKFGSFENSYIKDELPTEFTLTNLISLFEKLTDEINRFFNLFDPLFNISKNREFSTSLTNTFTECKLPLIYIKVGFIFFIRKINILKTTLLNLPLTDYENVNTNELIEQFISKHKSTTYVDDIGSLKSEFLKFFELETNILTMIKSQEPEYKPSVSNYSILTMLSLGMINDLNKRIPELFAQNVKILDDIPNEQLMEFLVMIHKLDISNQVFENFYLIPQESIWEVPENSEEWCEMKKRFQRLVPYNKKDVKEMLQKVFEFIKLGYASFSKGYSGNKNDILKTAKSGLYMALYFVDKTKAKRNALKFLVNPDPEISKKVWNIIDIKGIGTAAKVALPSIKYVDKFYLKCLAPEITLETISQLDQEIKKSNFELKQPKIITDIISSKLKVDNKGNPDLTEVDKLIKQKISNEEDKKNYTTIKLYHNETMRIPSSGYLKQFINTFYNPPKTQTRDSLIIHIHGGGFVAMSPTGHENYTRKWAKRTGVPLIGIKYSLSPEHPFPKALNEVYQTYLWILTYMEDIFNIKIKNIILAGDSAGGNLCVSLVYLLLVNKLRLPNVVFLVYPALKLTLKRVNISYMNSITDPILEYNLLKCCAFAYAGNCDEFNQFLSPLFMDDKIMKLLPPIRIVGGSSDPLRDDSILLFQKLVKLNVDVTMKEIKYFPHGFLNYDIPNMMPESGIATDIIVEEMEKFIKERTK